jgi:hypothetical protein
VPGGRTSLYYDLLDGFKQPGCGICRFALRAVERFLDALAYENTNDPGIRNGVRAARGFCNRHTEQYLRLGDELGTAIIYRDLLHTIIPALEEAAPEGLAGVAGTLTDPSGDRQASRAQKALAPDDLCYACRRLGESEEHYLATLTQHLGNRDFAAAYERSAGLCAVHFGRALQACRDRSRQDLLVRTQQRSWQELLERAEREHPDPSILEQALASAVGGRGLRP